MKIECRKRIYYSKARIQYGQMLVNSRNTKRVTIRREPDVHVIIHYIKEEGWEQMENNKVKRSEKKLSFNKFFLDND